MPKLFLVPLLVMTALISGASNQAFAQIEPQQGESFDRAVQGDAEAQYNRGMYYTMCKTKDYPEAAKWFRKSANQGFAEAQHKLGVLYDGGKGLPQDYSEAAKWYRKAADQGHAAA